MSHSSITHLVSGVKCHTCSSGMPRPQQGCLGPPLSGIGVTVLLGCSLSSFMETSFSDNWLLTSIPSWITPKCIPHTRYPTMFIWTESFLSSRINSHQYTGQSSSFQPDWTQYAVNVTLLQMVGWLASCQKLTGYPFYLSGKMSLCSLLLSWALGGWPIPASWFVMVPEGFPFYSSTKRGWSGHWNEWAVIGHIQKVGLVWKLVPGCLACYHTLDSLIRDLINQLR